MYNNKVSFFLSYILCSRLMLLFFPQEPPPLSQLLLHREAMQI
jgi:hypothetical protein